MNENGTREGREAGWERRREVGRQFLFIGLIFLAQVVQPARIPGTQCQFSCQSLGRSSPWSGRRNFGPVACAVLTPRTNSRSAAGLLKGQTVHSSLKLDIHLKYRLVKSTGAAAEVSQVDLVIIDEVSKESASMLEGPLHFGADPAGASLFSSLGISSSCRRLVDKQRHQD